MKSNLRNSLFLNCLIAWLLAGHCVAQESVFSKLNPFKGGKDASERKSSVFNGGAIEDDSGSDSGGVVSASAEQPVNASSTRRPLNFLRPLGLVKRPFVALGNSTKSAFRKTTSWLNPFDKPKESPKPINQGYRPQDEYKEPKKSMWRYLLPYDPEPERPEVYDVNSFLGLPQQRLP